MFNKTFLITGGTGSWGEELVKQLLVKEPKEIRIFSRNESLQAQMRQAISDPRVKFVLGDIRDRWELAGACKDINYVFHLAALKHVPVCEDQPDCAVKTNIIGTQNVIDAAIENGVQKVVYVSTDKAANPSSMYGMTKAIGEKLILLADTRSATSFACVRSGNVLGSTGSVVPLFKRQLELEQPLSVTDSRMTRFFLPLGEGVEILLSAMEQCEGGEIIVPQMPSCKITDIAQVLAEDAGHKDAPIHFIGARPGERLYETLISDWENVCEVEEDKSYFVVTASPSSKLVEKEGCRASASAGRGYHSEDVILTKAEVRDMLWRGGISVFKRRIIFTGGGSAGHVTANLILISRLLQEGWEIHYIGSKHGIERQLIGKIPAVHYHAVATGKLRRYWAWANVSDVFKIMLGLLQAYLLILRIKPHVCFSLGGFVAVPAVIGASLNRVPVLILEPDLHPGLANRLSRRYAQIMCTTFMDTTTFASAEASGKTVYVGPVIREELKLGSRARGIHFCRFVSDRPILLIMGGSQGSERLNRMVLETLPELLKRYQIIHICGTGKLNSCFPQVAGYKSFEYVHEELADLMAMADMVVSRAGSNAIHEWLLLRKPMLLIPHAHGGSRVGQTLNAKYFQERGYARVLHEEELTAQTFLRDIDLVYKERERMIDHMKASGTENAVDKVLELIHTTVSSVEKAENE